MIASTSGQECVLACAYEDAKQIQIGTAEGRVLALF